MKIFLLDSMYLLTEDSSEIEKLLTDIEIYVSELNNNDIIEVII
jgi:hypothetical protein